MKNFFRNISLLLLMAWACILFSSCGVLSYFESMGREAILWEELENSVDEETAAKDTTSFHNARYQVKSRIVMSDLERVSSEHILKLFSDQVISEIGRDALASSLEKMAESIQGELLSYETRDRGGSGQRGGSGETTRTYEVVSVQKVLETNTSGTAATADNRITLFTCVRDQSAYRWCVQAVEV